MPRIMPACVIARRRDRRRHATALGRRLAAGRLHRFREAEVENLHRAVGAHFDIRRLQIAVNDALFVRGFERLGDLLRDGQRLVERDRAPRDALRQVLALDELHHQRGDAPTFFEPVDARDVRMVQRGEGLGFAREPRQAVGIMRERFGQDLDRDVTIQLRVARAEDLPHAAFADRRDDFVDAEARAGSEAQVAAV